MGRELKVQGKGQTVSFTAGWSWAAGTEHLPEPGPGTEAAGALPLHAKRVQTQMHILNKEEHALQESQGTSAKMENVLYVLAFWRYDKIVN